MRNVASSEALLAQCLQTLALALFHVCLLPSSKLLANHTDRPCYHILKTSRSGHHQVSIDDF